MTLSIAGEIEVISADEITSNFYLLGKISVYESLI